MKEVKIGSQIWAQEDLKVTRFRNGDLIPVVQDPEQWSNMESAAMCINSDIGAYLYNWYAVIDPRGLAPKGWHIPSDDEWTELIDFLGGEDVAALKMKSAEPVWNGANESGFSGLPSGYRSDYGDFQKTGYSGYWWSSSLSYNRAWYRVLSHKPDYVHRNNGYGIRFGFSVRCVKDKVVCNQPKEDLRVNFDELTSRLDALAVQVDKLQGSMDCLLKSKS